MDESKQLTVDLIKILNKAIDNKIYGSVEIYFESGKITQVTQRIINKVRPQNQKETSGKKLKATKEPKKNLPSNEPSNLSTEALARQA